MSGAVSGSTANPTLDSLLPSTNVLVVDPRLSFVISNNLVDALDVDSQLSSHISNELVADLDGGLGPPSFHLQPLTQDFPLCHTCVARVDRMLVVPHIPPCRTCVLCFG